MSFKRLSIFTMALFMLLSACTPKNEQTGIQVEGAWARAASAMGAQATSSEPGSEHTGMGANSAVYMVLHNPTDTTDRLLKVDCDAVQAAELHQSLIQDGVMRMQQVQEIEIPAQGEAKLEPGGLHVMLIGLHQDLVAGKKLSLTLVFENAGEMVIEAEIRAP